MIEIIKKPWEGQYVAGFAQLDFKPTFDWTVEEAKRMYEKKIGNEMIVLDKVEYQDCLVGLKNLPDESVDCIVADPPFGLDATGKESQYNRNANYVLPNYRDVAEQNYQTFTNNWVKECYRVLNKKGTAMIVSGWTHVEKIITAIREAGFYLLNDIIWRHNFGLCTKHKFVSSHYHILFISKHPTKYYFNLWQAYAEDVFVISRENMPKKIKNGNKLPTKLVQTLLMYIAKPGDIVLDPFMGNGTTAYVAKSMYLHYIGFEINKECQKVIESNLEQHKIGELYKPFSSYLPSFQDLLEKYPHLKNYAKEV